MSELKPCPFCGCKASTSHGVERDGDQFVFVSCETCHCKTTNFYKWVFGDKYEQEARRVWNRRVSDG